MTKDEIRRKLFDWWADNCPSEEETKMRLMEAGFSDEEAEQIIDEWWDARFWGYEAAARV